MHTTARLLHFHIHHKLCISLVRSLLALKYFVPQIRFPKRLKLFKINVVAAAIVVMTTVHASQVTIESQLALNVNFKMVAHVVIVCFLLF